MVESPDACAEPPPGLLLERIGLFNRGEFYEQHELLETLWRQESATRFAQGERRRDGD